MLIGQDALAQVSDYLKAFSDWRTVRVDLLSPTFVMSWFAAPAISGVGEKYVLLCESRREGMVYLSSDEYAHTPSASKADRSSYLKLYWATAEAALDQLIRGEVRLLLRNTSSERWINENEDSSHVHLSLKDNTSVGGSWGAVSQGRLLSPLLPGETVELSYSAAGGFPIAETTVRFEVDAKLVDLGLLNEASLQVNCVSGSA